MFYSVQSCLNYFNSIHQDFSFMDALMHVCGTTAHLAWQHSANSFILILWLLWKSLVPFFVDVWKGCNQPLVRIRLAELKPDQDPSLFFCKSIKYVLLNGDKLHLAQTELRDACLDAKWHPLSGCMTERLVLSVSACHIFVGEDYTLCFSRSHIRSDVRNNFPWTPTALCSSLAHCPGISQ